MVERRWRRMLGPGVVAMAGLVAVGSLAPAPVGAGPWSPAACRASRPDPGGLATAGGPATLEAVGRLPWYRLDPVLDAAGMLIGQRLTVGINGARLDRSLILPPKSFAAGPFGGSVLVGADDGRASRLMTIDVARRCTTAIAETGDVIRGATIDPDGLVIHEHRVDRATRTDLGIWRRAVAGGEAERWLDPIGPDPRFGRTWSTHLGWNVDGAALVVQSCAETACRIRVADPGTAAVRTLADPSIGFAVGVAGDRVVAHGACRGLPCPLVSVELATGRATVVEPEGGAATVVPSTRGARIVVEALAADAARLRDMAADGTDDHDLGPLGAGLRLGEGRGSHLRLPGGWVLVAPDGDLRGTDDRSTTSVRSVLDGRTVPMDEVIR